MKTMVMSATTLRGLDVVIALHTLQEPTVNEWAVYVELQLKLKRKAGGDVSKIRNIVITDGGAPNAKQRAQMQAEVFGTEGNKVSVISNSLNNPLKRGIATAISWVNPEFKALLPEQWRDALKHIDLTGEIRPILLELERMQTQITPVSTLTQLAALA